jgi:hypothetical protein
MTAEVNTWGFERVETPLVFTSGVICAVDATVQRGRYVFTVCCATC